MITLSRCLTPFATLTLALVAYMGAATPALAGPIFFSPDSVSATNTNHGTALPGNLIDLSGLSATPVTLAGIGGVTHSFADANIWRGSTTLPPPNNLTFGFDSAQTIDYVGMWQGVHNFEGVGDFQLTFWDGAGGSGMQIGGVYTDVLDPVATAPLTIPLFGRAFDVGTREDVRSIVMTIFSVAAPSPGSAGNVHFGEFMVATAPVPEPGTWALFGLAALGLGLNRARRRRKCRAR